ncbi:hypothetical protein SBOR_6298 [Sclerotinia borealis F-4128]|uniref:Uncharacterized protein n=1 Tax=Sclerotinia borealis (strain F-4128) TaxID=1432307 RepID=W9C9A4_SCLBF|nr:hypothetical protein SBOR_6298 [Sclerotinia borealis F-4128]
MDADLHNELHVWHSRFGHAVIYRLPATIDQPRPSSYTLNTFVNVGGELERHVGWSTQHYTPEDAIRENINLQTRVRQQRDELHIWSHPDDVIRWNYGERTSYETYLQAENQENANEVHIWSNYGDVITWEDTITNQDVNPQENNRHNAIAQNMQGHWRRLGTVFITRTTFIDQEDSDDTVFITRTTSIDQEDSDDDMANAA